MIKELEFENIEGAAITENQASDFLQTAQQLSEFIRNLNLDQPTNNQLVDLMVYQVHQAWNEAFTQGFQMGKEYAGWEADRTEEVQQGNGLMS